MGTYWLIYLSACNKGGIGFFAQSLVKSFVTEIFKIVILDCPADEGGWVADELLVQIDYGRVFEAPHVSLFLLF